MKQTQTEPKLNVGPQRLPGRPAALATALLAALFGTFTLAPAPAGAQATGAEAATPDVAVEASADGDPGDEASPRAVILALQDSLLAYMGAAAAAGGRPEAAAVAGLQDAIRATHDFPYIARIVLGRYWRELDEARQQAFIERFTALSLATYANRFTEFSGESFTITGESEGGFGQRKIDATLSTGGGEHAFEYLLRDTAEGWRIVNIIVDGVSDLALKRAEYASLYAERGFDGLMQELEAQRLALMPSG